MACERFIPARRATNLKLCFHEIEIFWWNMTGWSWRFVRTLFYQDRGWWNRISIIIDGNPVCLLYINMQCHAVQNGTKPICKRSLTLWSYCTWRWSITSTSWWQQSTAVQPSAVEYHNSSHGILIAEFYLVDRGLRHRLLLFVNSANQLDPHPTHAPSFGQKY